MCVCCDCSVLSGRGLCDELITGPEESYRMSCVVECDLENLVNEEVLAHWGLSRQINKTRTENAIVLASAIWVKLMVYCTINNNGLLNTCANVRRQ